MKKEYIAPGTFVALIAPQVVMQAASQFGVSNSESVDGDAWAKEDKDWSIWGD